MLCAAFASSDRVDDGVGTSHQITCKNPFNVCFGVLVLTALPPLSISRPIAANSLFGFSPQQQWCVSFSLNSPPFTGTGLRLPVASTSSPRRFHAFNPKMAFQIYFYRRHESPARHLPQGCINLFLACMNFYWRYKRLFTHLFKAASTSSS